MRDIRCYDDYRTYLEDPQTPTEQVIAKGLAAPPESEDRIEAVRFIGRLIHDHDKMFLALADISSISFKARS
jgi:hypothetical protein